MSNKTINQPKPCEHCGQSFVRAHYVPSKWRETRFCSLACFNAVAHEASESLSIDSPAVVARFDSKYLPEPMSGCWLWTESCSPEGYGKFWFHGEDIGGHRVSWLIHRGPIPAGVFVCHRCDIPACVNPDHLFLGEAGDNMRDKAAKLRHSYGERVNTAKLTVEQVRLILVDPRGPTAIAKDYGVSATMICNIQHRKSWKQVTLG